jgi:2-phospho-L-lactate guanylyltransferase
MHAAAQTIEMKHPSEIWAVVPVKETEGSKQRLASALSATARQAIVLAMLEDVLAALSIAQGLAGIVLATLDPQAIKLAARYGAQCIDDGARDGHTGSVTAAARRLKAEGADGILQVPGDIPLITPAEIETLLAAHKPAPSFTIAPSHDELGSNAVLLSPPDAVPLRFGDDSFFPHLAAARACGIEPTIVRLPGIALDIDNPVDLAHFSRLGSHTRAGLWLAENMPALGRET